MIVSIFTKDGQPLGDFDIRKSKLTPAIIWRKRVFVLDVKSMLGAGPPEYLEMDVLHFRAGDIKNPRPYVDFS